MRPLINPDSKSSSPQLLPRGLPLLGFICNKAIHGSEAAYRVRQLERGHQRSGLFQPSFSAHTMSIWYGILL